MKGSIIPTLHTGEMEAQEQQTTKKKTPAQDVKFGAALHHHTHSWMEKKGMLEGSGMMAAPGTALQEVNGLRLRKSTWDQEELSKRQPARKMLWP